MIHKLQCAWCKIFYGMIDDSCDALSEETISHGICKSCIVKYFPEQASQVLALVKNKTIKNSKID